VAAKRTAFGAFGGHFKTVTCTDLATAAAKAALAAGNVNPEIVDTVVVGNVIQSNRDTAYVSRHTGLRAGVKLDTPCLTVNRLCGSGFQAIISGAQDIQLGDADVALVGGAENMSEAPFLVRNVRFGTQFGVDYKFEDMLWGALTDQHIKTPMGITAENLAEKYGISRADCDAYAVRSQERWLAAHELGAFREEMAPVVVKSKKGDVSVEKDQHPRLSSAEQLARLAPVFKKGGVVTAGNASGVCDGAGMLVLASEEALAKHNLTPLARLVGYGVSGCEPSIMGIGPVPAIHKLLKRTGHTLSQVDLVDVNEAFAAQYLAVERELGLDPESTNVSGGAIALGHPVGASGARIAAHLTHELKRRNLKTAIGSACIGGGQGIAVMLERM